MKKNWTLSFCLLVLLNLFFTRPASAQKGTDYTTALGLRLDLGTGGTYVGPSVKHFFSPKDAGAASVLFGSHTTFIGAEYSYNGLIKNAGGLKWNVGVGPQILLYSSSYYYGGGSDVWLRPFAGLEYKIADAPLALGFDWRPIIGLTHGGGFEAGRFGLDFRFVLK